MRRVLVADGTEAFRTALAEELSGTFLVKTCGNGKETLEILPSFCPDVLVLDLMIPGLDGISLLQSAMSSGMRAQILVTTRYVSDYVAESLEGLGVGYLIVKPCDINATVQRIKDLAQKPAKLLQGAPNHFGNVSAILFALGVPTKLRGYTCLREAILCMAKKPGQSITKELYPAVAELCNGTASQVERSIRSAITAAWKDRDEVLWRRYFGSDRAGHMTKPTNAVLITRVADLLMIDENENFKC